MDQALNAADTFPTEKVVVKLSFAIQAVEQRRPHVETILDRLHAQLPQTPEFVGVVSVAYDTDLLGCWHSWSRAWDAHRVWADVTHHVVLQDDVLLCADFPETMMAIAKARPDDVVSGFLPRRCVNRAVASGKHWARTRRFLWAQCMMLPVALGDACVQWVADHEGTHASVPWGRSGDMRLASWLNAHRRPVFVAVPHPVEHIGDALPGKSVMGHNGKPEGRRARAWLGEHGRGAGLPWNDLAFERD